MYLVCIIIHTIICITILYRIYVQYICMHALQCIAVYIYIFTIQYSYTWEPVKPDLARNPTKISRRARVSIVHMYACIAAVVPYVQYICSIYVQCICIVYTHIYTYIDCIVHMYSIYVYLYCIVYMYNSMSHICNRMHNYIIYYICIIV